MVYQLFMGGGTYHSITPLQKVVPCIGVTKKLPSPHLLGIRAHNYDLIYFKAVWGILEWVQLEGCGNMVELGGVLRLVMTTSLLLLIRPCNPTLKNKKIGTSKMLPW